MKFSKTYLQTMTDPSFPKEWREKGLEYKELKKLINGVVAELESLGLSADVLRDLLEPPDQQRPTTTPASSTDVESVDITQAVPDEIDRRPKQRPTSSSSGASGCSGLKYRHRSRSSDESDPSSHPSDSEGGEDVHSSLVAGLARLSTGRSAVSGFVDPLSPLMEEEEARKKSVEKAMIVPPFAPGEAMPSAVLLAANEASRSSPAGEWLATVARPHHHYHHHSDTATRGPRREKKRSKRSASPAETSSDGQSSRADSERVSLGPSHQRPKHLSVAAEDRPQLHRASPMDMLGIPSQYRASSVEVDETGAGLLAASPGTSWKLGKKDLQQFRRNSHSGATSRPSSVNIDGEGDHEGHDWDGHAWRERQGLGWEATQEAANGTEGRPGTVNHGKAAPPIPGSRQGRWVHGKDGRRARAEYELAGTPEHPTPRIKLIIESPINSDDESESSSEEDGNDDDGRITELPSSQPVSPHALAEGDSLGTTSCDVDGSTSATVSDDDRPQRKRTREIIIPLTADTEFLDTLTASLSKLSMLQESQRGSFVTSTEDLCASVARVASPYATKSDLYVWREIFQLWVDMQIFESQREKDRGELSVDESEARLKRFAEELAKRGWLAENAVSSSQGLGGMRLSRSKQAMESALTLPMKSSQSTSAVEDFLRLNLALLDVKKFQRVNVEAARKILKKHDKRTALTASFGLRDFVRQQEAARTFTFAMGGAAAMMGSSGSGGLPAESTGTLVAPAYGTHPSLAALLPSSTTGLLSESLPHILLSLLTTTLLPILPSVDDYSCAICTGLAWRPIRLDCFHLFCIRCLVKLQKSGKKHCPLCRAPDVVATADGRNMDEATVNMLRMWFPQEVDEKEHENESDRKKEELKELGLRKQDCLVM